MQKYKWIPSILTILLLIVITTAIFLYTNGYRLEKQKNKNFDVTKTGMVSAKSNPEGASVYLDGILVTATNDSIPGIEPGIKDLKIVKKGYVTWEKNIEVFAELVTDITAVLITQSPRIEPLTNTGAFNPSVAPSLSKIAYFTKDATEPGISILSLAGGFWNNEPTLILKDTRALKYSEGKEIVWSYDESELLIKMSNDVWYLVDLQTSTAHTTNVPDTIKKNWRDEFLKKRESFISNAEVRDEIKQLATSENVVWAPDEKKFLNIEDAGTQYVYKVYNLESPIPVGEKAETEVFRVEKASNQPKVSWYTDSFHLILTEGDVATTQRGKVSFIRIDGTNKTEIYNNTLFSDHVYSTQGGDKVIILTSFKSESQPDLYTVSIR